MSIINTSKLIEDNTELITMFDAASKDLINIYIYITGLTNLWLNLQLNKKNI